MRHVHAGITLLDAVEFGRVLRLGVGLRLEGLHQDGSAGGLGVFLKEILHALGVVDVLLGQLHIIGIAHVKPDRHLPPGVLGFLEDGTGSLGKGVDIAFGSVPPGGGHPLGDHVQGGHQQAEEEDNTQGLPSI